MRTLYKVPQKTWKNCFLTLFVGSRAKSSKKRCLSHFLQTFYKMPRKTWETLFSHCFCVTSCKKLKKPCFFAFYANFIQSVSKNVKNTVFSHFLWDVMQKALNTLFFSIYCELSTKCLKKTGNKHCFLTLFVKRRAKCSKTIFYRFFVNFVQSVSKNVKKHCF